MNVFYYLSNELTALEWETNMHNIALGDRCALIDIYTKRLMPALNDLHQCPSDFSDADDDHNLLHGSVRRQM